jgi:uncharacterized damage-inducible protein DinB
MTIAEILLCDFDAEAVSTRRVLERVPDDKASWKPHEKSFALSNMAVHVATLPAYGLAMLSTGEMDVATYKSPRFEFDTAEKLVEVAAGAAAELRTKLASMTDEELQVDWTLRFGEHVIATGPKYLLYRTTFFNHLVHHRGQLNVYLRLLDVKVPGIYGPSADEPFGS